jgi:phage baseplate assembly protein W
MSAPRFRALRFVHPDIDADLDSMPGLQLDSRGDVAVVAEGDAVRQALLLLLTTIPGERVNRPDYGCPLHRLLFARADDTTAGLAIHYVRQAISRWEPRVEILEVDASPGYGGDRSRPAIEVSLTYRVRLTQDVGSLNLLVPLTGGAPQ